MMLNLKTLNEGDKMKTIWKFDVMVNDSVDIEMPAKAEILSIQTQGGLPRMWALVDPNAEKEMRHFAVFGTGHKHPDEVFDRLVFIGTFQLAGGALVFHLFERKK